MKKEDLIKLGLDEKSAEKAAESSAEELKGFIPKSRFDEVSTEAKALKAQLAERDTQLAALQTSTGDAAALQAQIAQLQADNKAKDEAHQAEMQALKLNAAVDAALAAAGAKNLKAAKALLDLENAELAEDGAVKGLKEQLDRLVKAEDSKFMFDTGMKKAAIKGAAPAQSGVEDPDGAVDTSQMSYEQLAAFMAENPDATF